MLRGERHDFVVSCDHCDQGMYRVVSDRVVPVSVERLLVPPVEILLQGTRRLIFCSVECVIFWLQDAHRLRAPELRGAYPLFWGEKPEPPLESRRPTDDPGGSS